VLAFCDFRDLGGDGHGLSVLPLNTTPEMASAEGARRG
jgi:hypothetical protein